MIRPAGRNVLIKPLKEEVKFGSLHLPDTAKKKASDGVVFALGEWCNQVKMGEWVAFSRKQATDVEVDGEQYIIVDERAILVVLEEEESGESEKMPE